MEIEPVKEVGQVDIWTIQLAQWRWAKANDIHVLDITAKSGVQVFAPDFGNVMAYKRGEMSKEDYAAIYRERMAYMKEKYPLHWWTLKRYPKVALACYCRAGVFCHRHLFRDIMKDYLEQHDIKVVLRGELLSGQKVDNGNTAVAADTAVQPAAPSD